MKKLFIILILFLPFLSFSKDNTKIKDIIKIKNTINTLMDMLPTSDIFTTVNNEVQKFYNENEDDIIFAIENKLLDVNQYIRENSPILFEIANIKAKPDQATFNILNAMLKNGADINVKNLNTGNTLLIEAIEFNNEELVNFLIEKKINLNKQNKEGETALFKACAYNREKLIECLIKAGADVNIIDASKFHPFYYFCKESDNIELYKLFIQHGVDVNKKLVCYEYQDEELTLETTTPLNIYLSRLRPKIEIVSLLLENKANPNQTDSYGNNSLYYAIDNYYCDEVKNPYGCKPEIIELLLKFGANIYQQNKEKTSPLSYAVSNWNVDVISIFQEHEKINYKIKTEKNGNLFHSLFQNPIRFEGSYNYFNDLSNLEKLINLLLENKIDINGKNKNGETPLMMAFDNKNIIQLLLSKGADINLTDNKGNTTLHFAALGQPEKLKLLLENGVNPNLKNKNKKNAYEYLISNLNKASKKTTECISILYNLTPHTDNELTLTESIFIGNLEYTQKLIELDSNKTDYNEEVFSAIESDIPQMLTLILQKNPDLSYKSSLYYETPLIFAIQHLNLEMVEILLQSGANPNIFDEFDNCPLLYLIKNKLFDNFFWEHLYYNHYDKDFYYRNNHGKLTELIQDMIYLLIKYGTDLNYYSKVNKETIFLTLFKSDYLTIDILKCALDKGANVFVYDNENNTITDLINSKSEEKQQEYSFIYDYAKKSLKNKTAKTSSNIKLKDSNSNNSSTIGYLPENTLVKIIDSFPEKISIHNNFAGCIVKIETLSYIKQDNTIIPKGTTGYVFSGYLEIK